jgi:hypothetical protein
VLKRSVMSTPTYSRLYGYTGVVFMIIGAAFFPAFIAFLALGHSPVPTNAVGHYFVAFAASAMIGWGGSLRAAASDAALRRRLAIATAIGMALMGLYRIIIVVASVEVRAWGGWVPAIEAVACAVLTVAFVRTRMGGD